MFFPVRSYSHQLNHNKIADWGCISVLAANKKLDCVYLEGNAIQTDVRYRQKIKLAVPHLTKIDATLCQ